MALSQTTIHAEIGLLVTRLARVWRREADRALAERGLSEATALPLMVLSRQEKGVRQGALAEALGIEGPSLVRLIDLLQADGLVERREDLTDRRARTLHLSAQGKAKAREANQALRRLRAYLLKDIAGDDLAKTFETLRMIEQRASRLSDSALAAEG